MAFCTKNKRGNHFAKIKRSIRKIKRRFILSKLKALII